MYFFNLGHSYKRSHALLFSSILILAITNANAGDPPDGSNNPNPPQPIPEQQALDDFPTFPEDAFNPELFKILEKNSPFGFRTPEEETLAEALRESAKNAWRKGALAKTKEYQMPEAKVLLPIINTLYFGSPDYAKDKAFRRTHELSKLDLYIHFKDDTSFINSVQKHLTAKTPHLTSLEFYKLMNYLDSDFQTRFTLYLQRELLKLLPHKGTETSFLLSQHSDPIPTYYPADLPLRTFFRLYLYSRGLSLNDFKGTKGTEGGTTISKTDFINFKDNKGLPSRGEMKAMKQFIQSSEKDVPPPKSTSQTAPCPHPAEATMPARLDSLDAFQEAIKNKMKIWDELFGATTHSNSNGKQGSP